MGRIYLYYWFCRKWVKQTNKQGNMIASPLHSLTQNVLISRLIADLLESWSTPPFLILNLLHLKNVLSKNLMSKQNYNFYFSKDRFIYRLVMLAFSASHIQARWGHAIYWSIVLICIGSRIIKWVWINIFFWTPDTHRFYLLVSVFFTYPGCSGVIYWVIVNNCRKKIWSRLFQWVWCPRFSSSFIFLVLIHFFLEIIPFF